ncbi:transposase, partial [Rhodococcus sp. WS4]
RKTTTDGDLPARSYQALMGHLATLTRNDLRYGDDGPIVATLAIPTATQRRAFELLDTTIPLTVR